MAKQNDPTPDVAIVDGHPCVSSLAIADHFQKRHTEVLRAIRVISQECPSEFNERNFASVEYADLKGEMRPMYQLSRDGFTLLAMGFAGKKALVWKLRYIEAFNAMEKALAEKAKPKALPKSKQKALPAPEVPFAEKAMKAATRVTALRNEAFLASREMREVFATPFWNAKQMPEDRKRFAQAMNDTMGHFFMAISTCAAAADEMFKAYVEGENILNK